MRLKVRHETTYHYGAAARSAIQMLRMTPRSSGSQFVRRWRVEVDADARLDRDEDAFGNITHTVFLAGPLLSVKVTVEGEVDTTDANGIVSGTVERQPPALFLRDTALTQPSPELRAYARACAADAGTDQLAAMHSLMERLADDISFDSSATTSSTTAAQAFVARRGVCQDFAHMFIACARSIGVPARYVSGYYLLSDRIDQSAGHAWVETHLPDIGWVAFDATNRVCATDRYVRVAVGPDYLDAAPIRGSQTGGIGESLAIQVQVQQGRPVTEE
ncbi:MAG: transglutaminase family protein [Hyphomicrobiaceae bacterium]